MSEIHDIIENIATLTGLPFAQVEQAVKRIAWDQATATPLETTLRLYYQLTTAERFPRENPHPLVKCFREATQ
jgi:hypothetical protein